MPTTNIHGYDCPLGCYSANEVYKQFCSDKQTTETCSHCDNATFDNGIYTCKILVKDTELRGENE